MIQGEELANCIFDQEWTAFVKHLCFAITHVDGFDPPTVDRRKIVIFARFLLVSSGPGAFAKIRSFAPGLTVVDRAQGANVLGRNFQRENQRSAVSPAGRRPAAIFIG